MIEDTNPGAASQALVMTLETILEHDIHGEKAVFCLLSTPQKIVGKEYGVQVCANLSTENILVLLKDVTKKLEKKIESDRNNKGKQND